MSEVKNIPEGWVETTLEAVAEIKYGKDHKHLKDGDIPCLGSGGFMRNVDQILYDKPSVLIPRKGTISNLFFIEQPFWTVDTLFYTKIDESKIIPKYLYFKLKTINLENLNVGSAVPSLTTPVLNQLTIDIPKNITEQQSIAAILTSFDDKIELLQAQNKTLEEMAQTIFTEWFGKYRVDDELPEGWSVGKLGEVIEIYDSKRIPLSKQEREEKKGDYPYYGATSVMDYIDEYIFDGIYLLFAEDGSVIDTNGNPFLQYVWDKFWVNNHAHVLQGKNGFSTEILYVICKKMKVSEMITGAVQLKINQGNLINFEIIIPEKSILDKFNLIIQPIFSKIRANTIEIQTLTKTRDTLLPRLMSGEMRVKM
ncbi:type I restriction enzyme S subunit [Flavobacterium croceum DSM 17960]|uniref:Type I restriction enzyme S subunit n=1 Tax=Flavobacterium croceum DSM 17960 TaxID=1121886 RepID=A0A2S4N8I9_9FLAO|nr:restriction endonuclease subunit S [Flavobacterium croceum]POS02006.1 type I restriction enzyme S subunit [Flavobacterium croceum DSM 17960]